VLVDILEYLEVLLDDIEVFLQAAVADSDVQLTFQVIVNIIEGFIVPGDIGLSKMYRFWAILFFRLSARPM
jgi:predicted transcriptional regulator